MTVLRGIGWDHERCLGPLRAGARAWRERGGSEIVWEARSLRAFGDQPLEELAPAFDLLTIDYPFVGTAHATGCLAPLDDLLPAGTLAALAEDAIGPSHVSYEYAGHQWGLATDAACQVSAVRDDLLDGRPAPSRWDEVLEPARELRPRVVLPLVPADAISSFLTLCANAGAPPPLAKEQLADRAGALRALELLRELADLGPRWALEADPPRALDRMTMSDDVAYVPLLYGYTNYSRPGGPPRPCRFLDIPSAGHGPVGAILGGAGLAVSAASEHAEEGAAFAAWLTSAEVQRAIVFPAGGQPGSASAWRDEEIDRASGRFTSGTLRTIESAYVRPRDRWWPRFQLESGELLHAFLRNGGHPDAVLVDLEALYRSLRRLA